MFTPSLNTSLGPAPIQPGQPLMPPAVTRQSPPSSPPTAPVNPPTPAPTGESSVQVQPGLRQESSFSPVANGLFSGGRINRLAERLSTSNPANAELLESFQRLAEALKSMSPPPDSQLARIMNQFKAVMNVAAERLGLSAEAPPAIPSDPVSARSEAPTEASNTSESPPPESSEPPEVTGSSEGTSADVETESSESSDFVSESEHPLTDGAQGELKDYFDRLLEMLQEKRLNRELSTFSEEKIQERMRETMLKLSKFLRNG